MIVNNLKKNGGRYFMAENTIDTLQIKIESQSTDASAAIERLIASLNRLNPALSSAGTSGFKAFSQSITNAMTEFQKLRDVLQTPIKLNIDLGVNQDKIVSDIQSAIKKAANVKYAPLKINLDIDTNKIKTDLTEKLGALNLGDAFKGLSGISDINTDKIIEIGNAFRLFAASLSESERISGSASRIFTALSQLAASADKIPQISGNLPGLSNEIQNFISSMAGATNVANETVTLVESLSRLANAGKRAQEIIPILPRLASSISEFANSLRGAGDGISGEISNLSRGLIDFAGAISRFSEIRIGDINRAINSIERLGNVNFGNLGQNLRSITGLDFSSLNNLGNAFQQFAASLAGAERVPPAISRIFVSLSQLASASSSIPTVISSLPQLSSEIGRFISSMATAPTVQEGTVALVSALSGIASSGRRAQQVASALPGLTKGLTDLIMALSRMPKLNTNIVQLILALGRLSPISARAGNATGGLRNHVDKLSLSFLKLHGNTKNTVVGLKSFAKQLLAAMGIYVGIFGAVQGIKKSIDISSKLTEIQNVVDVTFGNMKQKIEDLASVSIIDFGMSELTAKQTASRFQAMGVAMGFTQEKMSDMSVGLTKLTADMASFYDVEQDMVAEKLGAIFTGQTRPLRDFGLDLTQATLQEWALAQGMDINIKKMSQMEKTMLRYQYVLANTTAAHGDFQRTVGTWANQTRVLIQQFQQLGSVIGGVFINAFKPLITSLNSVMQSIIAFAKTVANALGAIFGWTIEINSGGIANDFEEAGAGAEEIEDATGGAADNAKKLNKYIAPWHEVNNMTTDEGKKGGGGGGGGGGGLGDELGDAADAQLKRTESIFDKYKSEIDTLYKLGEYIGETLTSAMNNIDWDGIYQGAADFGHGLAEFLNGLISPELFGAFGNTVAGAINTALTASLAFSEAFDFTDFGVSLATGMNSALENIDWNKALRSAKNWGKGIANTVNGFIKKGDFDLVGQTVANGLNTAVEFFLSAGLTLNWQGVGNAIATSINGFFNTFDFAKLGQALNTWASGILSAAITAIRNTQWVTIGEKIGEFLEQINFLEIGSKIGALLWEAINAGIGLMAGMFEVAPIQATLVTALGALVISPKIISGIAAAKAAIDGLRTGLSGLAAAATAHPLIAIGTALGAVALGLFNIKKNWDKQMAQEFEEFQKNIGSNVDDLNLAAEALKKVGENTKYITDNAQEDADQLGKLGDAYLELANKSDLTQKEQEELKEYADKLIEQCPLLAQAIDGVTGKYTTQESEIRKLIQAQQEQMQVDAYQKVMDEYSQSLAKANVELGIAQKQQESNAESIEKLKAVYDDFSSGKSMEQWAKDNTAVFEEFGISTEYLDDTIHQVGQTMRFYEQEQGELSEAMKNASDEVERQTEVYETANEIMEQHKQNVDQITESSATYKQALSDLQTDLSNLNITLSEDFTKNLVKGNYDTSGLKEYFASIQQGVSADAFKLQKLFSDMGLTLPESLAQSLEGKDTETQAKAVSLLLGIQSGVQTTAPQLIELFSMIGVALPDNLTRNLASKSALVQSTTIELLSKVQSGYKLTEGNLTTLFQGLGLSLPEKLITSMEGQEAETQQKTIELLGEIAAGYDGTAPELLRKFDELGIQLPKDLQDALKNGNEDTKNQVIELLGQVLTAEENQRGPLLEKLKGLGVDLSELGFIPGIKDGYETTKNAGEGLPEHAEKGINSGIKNSETTVKEFGFSFAAIFATGITTGSSEITKAVQGLFTTALTTQKQEERKIPKPKQSKSMSGYALDIGNPAAAIPETVQAYSAKSIDSIIGYSAIDEFSGNLLRIRSSIPSPSFDFSPPKTGFTSKTYDMGSFRNTMRIEIDTKMASLEFENRQLRESVEECVSLLKSIYEKPTLSDDAVFNSARRGQKSYNSRTQLTGWSGID